MFSKWELVSEIKENIINWATEEKNRQLKKCSCSPFFLLGADRPVACNEKKLNEYIILDFFFADIPKYNHVNMALNIKIKLRPKLFI